MKSLKGIHHVTAITGDAQTNVDFYSGLLGLRLVKKTVNFDDPGSYHLYYGDRAGTPGTLVTFFVWPGARRGKAGVGEPLSVSFEIPEGSLSWWGERLKAAGSFQGAETRFGSQVITAHDPDGMSLELIEGSGPRLTEFWPGGAIAREHAIRAIQSITLGLYESSPSADVYSKHLTFVNSSSEGTRQRFTVGQDDRAGFVDVVQSPTVSRGRMGAGSIHHVAFRTENDSSQLAWLTDLTRLGLNVSPVMDRKYFHSIYFREPGGILFEIATDGPGMAVDEKPEFLGESLALPSEYESLRSELERTLVPIQAPATAVAKGV
jgi:glyoxalase family protein